MKALKKLLLVLILVFCTLVFASCDAKTVTRVYVNDEMHAIAEYSDGTTEDLGYVGVEKEVEKTVEVTPPKYTVTFLDADGNVLKTEKIYKGDAATPPEAPEISEKAFDRWDADFSAVTGDLTVRPVYVAAAEYTVNFLDETGELIDTVTVMHGKGATAPEAPKRADTIFKEWDTAFDCVKSDLTVKAVYRAKNIYTVTFKDYSGVVLATKTVKETDAVAAPTSPTRKGHTFTGWSGSLSNITSNKTVTAKYTLTAGTNLVDLDYTLKSDGTVEVLLSVKGTVNFSVFQGEITLPTGATLISTETLAKGSVQVNLQGENTLKFSAYDTNGYTAKTDVFKFVIRPASGADTLVFALSNEKMTDSNTALVSCPFIGDTLKLN